MNISGLLLAAGIVGTILIAGLIVSVVKKSGTKSGYCGGPENINMYDYPYWGYPYYEGRDTLWWDGDGRCSAFCQQSPCTVWCR